MQKWCEKVGVRVAKGKVEKNVFAKKVTCEGKKKMKGNIRKRVREEQLLANVKTVQL